MVRKKQSKKTKRGKYIIVEGIIGTGKTTQCKKLLRYLKKKHPNKKFIYTREPGGTEISEAIRRIVQGTRFIENMEPICEAYLYASSRAQSLRTVVKPALDKGVNVIADRSYITSISNSGGARGIGTKAVMTINKVAIKEVSPNLVIFIDLDLKTALTRISVHCRDKFESYGKSFYRKAVKGYTEASKLKILKRVWENVNGSGNEDAVFDRITKVVERKLKL